MKPVAKEKQTNPNSRRAFLQRSVMIGAGVATVAALPTQVLASAEAAPQFETKRDEGYHVSQHIADYYKSAQL